MSCGNSSFSVLSLALSSVENEGTHSSNCISNVFKFTIFSIWLLLFTIFFLLLLFNFVRNCLHSRSWNPQKRGFLLLLISSAVEMIRFSLFLSGVRGRGMYLLHSIPDPLISASISFFVRDWFAASTKINRPGNPHLGKVLTFFSFGIFSFLFIISSAYFITRSLGPLIFFHQPRILNWFYVSSYLLSGLNGALSITLLLIFASKLKTAIEPAFEVKQRDDALLIFVQKLDKVCQLAKIFFFIAVIPLSILPAWMAVTSSSTDPGMQYFFYFDFCAYTSAKFVGNVLIYWFLEKKHLTHTSSSGSSHDRTDSSLPRSQIPPPPPPFPRFSIQELNGDPSDV